MREWIEDVDYVAYDVLRVQICYDLPLFWDIRLALSLSGGIGIYACPFYLPFSTRDSLYGLKAKASNSTPCHMRVTEAYKPKLG